ncbi:MAG: iron-sulfur cluster assembly scaffold protein [Desulfobacula sp.]|nr:iron-sulfur cluster assembly scaffold protein [Desulfobacula sp.]
MNQINSEFLENHSLNYIEMALKTDSIERINNPDGYGIRIGDCGDSVEFFLVCQKGRLSSVSFFTRGCLNTNACCNTVVKLAKGKTIDRAWGIKPEQVARFLQTLPEDHIHCAELAVGALYLALTDLTSKIDKK